MLNSDLSSSFLHTYHFAKEAQAIINPRYFDSFIASRKSIYDDNCWTSATAT